MKRYLLVLLVFPLLSTSTQNNETTPGEWTSLFNGKDLDNWTMKIAGYKLGENFGNTFRVQDGILSIRYDDYGTFKDRFGALYYKKKFSNYRLKIEYRFVGETTTGAPEWGYRDSGIQYHCQSPESIELNQLFPVCLEYNLHGGNGKDDRPVGEICANGTFVEIKGKKNDTFCTPASVSKTFHGDQWVTVEIDVRDGKIFHFVNGEEILKYENPTYNPDHKIAQKLIINGNTSVKDGYISLQSNSHPIDFRRIDILEYQ